MMVTFQCPVCEAEIKRDAQLVPTYVRCPACNTSVMTPAVGIGPGTQLGGFRIERLIGRGSMGEVYLATQLSMDRQVALKILPPAITKDENLVKRFLHEVRMLARVEHPHMVTAFEAGEHEGVYYLAMSYVEGEDLSTRMERDKILPERDALHIIEQVASALSYAWKEQGILHNDIKPANIMMDRQGSARIMDVGLSKTTYEETGLSMTGVAFGTPNYMSPEQSRGIKDLDFRSDQYALGVTLYHMVTGVLPHTGTTVAEILTKKNMEPFRPAREVNPDISESCEHFIEVLLSKDREQRYPSWDAMLLDLARVLEGEEPLAVRPAAGQSMMVQAFDGGDDYVEGGKRRGKLGPYSPYSRREVVLAMLLLASVVAGAAAFIFLPREKVAEPIYIEVDEAALVEEAPVPVVEPDTEVPKEDPDEIVQVFFQRFELEFEPAPDLKPADEGTLHDALADLQEANGGETFQALYRIRGDYISLDLSGNAMLQNIDALARLPLVELLLHDTRVESLGALKDMPLARVGLNGTPIKDISVLSDLPIEELSLWHCDQLHDLSPLAKSTKLTKLLIPSHSEDIEFLRDVTSLEYLSSQPDGWKTSVEDFWAMREGTQAKRNE